ncbi:glycerol-3-phosphate dehydrogenase/oxidase [Algibacter mikhailovii]|uniref:glycerol-3-phosphate dehydrogenase/oxidase n=1 Tax=Algibacter mikhailovii TaxID=425498 RepID=UPI00249566B0|nr:glycerol-3-phosphate dehydrogenase/oxidase [Algibacter mikhailovii]
MKKPLEFSFLNRPVLIEQLQTETFDVAIIGGGITGAGIALDAATRGLKVCLIEKLDFASGTSNKSTKLIHGGLRYLKQFEIGLVRESGTERAIVHKLAPHLVVPVKMLLPLVEGGTYGKIMTSLGLKLYDFLANVNGDDKRLMLDKNETLVKEALLDKNTILGGGLYAEYRTDDARLTIEILKKAASFGATIVNYCVLESFNYNANSKINYLNCTDKITGTNLKIKAVNYVSAAGPWVDQIRAKDQSMSPKHLHLSKGVHIVFPFEKLPIKQSLYFDVCDGRMIFAIPRGRITYVGTTDTNYYSNIDQVVATRDDAKYLLQGINKAFPTVNLSINDIESNWAGLRPLIYEEDKDPSELSRKDELFISKSGLISIAGGKLTGYRRMAHRAIEAVLKTNKTMVQEDLEPSKTENIPLVTPSLKNTLDVEKYQKQLETTLIELGVSNNYYAWYLCSTYGKNADIIIRESSNFSNQDVLERLIRAELLYCLHHEMTGSLSDFFVRRTGRLYFDIKSINTYMPLILNDFINYLNWDTARVNFEKDNMALLIKDATTFYAEEFK